MCDVSAQRTAAPYSVDSGFTLRAVGRWQHGGAVEVRFDDELMATIDLPAAEWAVAAMLIEAGMRSADATWGSAFMTTGELARGLYRRSRRGNSDPANVGQVVYRLRTSTEKQMSGLVPHPKGWSRLLIQNRRYLGYRLGLPPENLHLEILGERNLQLEPTAEMKRGAQSTWPAVARA
jgi:hypothetical protein